MDVIVPGRAPHPPALGFVSLPEARRQEMLQKDRAKRRACGAAAHSGQYAPENICLLLTRSTQHFQQGIGT
jgi:hypothetical protein